MITALDIVNKGLPADFASRHIAVARQLDIIHDSIAIAIDVSDLRTEIGANDGSGQVDVGSGQDFLFDGDDFVWLGFSD